MATGQHRSMHTAGDGCQEQLTYTAADDESFSHAVVMALREAAGVTSDSDVAADSPPVGVLTPLYETIDPDALNALFSSTERSPRTGTVTFTHDGYEVTVSATGEIVVSNP